MTTKFDIGDRAYLIVRREFCPQCDPPPNAPMFAYKPVIIWSISISTGAYGVLERYGVEGDPCMYQSQLLFHHQDEALAYIEALNEYLR